MSGEELAGLQAGLKALAADMRGVEAPARVEQRLVESFRASAARPARWAPRPRRAWWLPLTAWATAAAAGLALGVFITRVHQPVQAPQRARSAIQLAADWSAETEIISSDDSGFVPLPNAESIAPNEEVDVVRVEVPRSAIMAWGLPVSEEQISERVNAEILMGADGMARAVRIWKD